MTKELAVPACFLAGIALALFSGHVSETRLAGENMHSEINRLRHDLVGVRSVLVVANGLLAAIIGALVF